MYLLKIVTGLLIACVLWGCQPETEPVDRRTARFKADSAALMQLIRKGDDVYAQKQGYASFAASLPYVDSAQVIANRWNDRLMQARTVAARARVYDAWNKEPQQTINYFRRTVELYKPIREKHFNYFYAKHLLAHAYDKVQDSTQAVGVLNELLDELTPKDTARLHEYVFTAEMALIATEVKAYPLAETILSRLTRRAWIKNDPETYNYLDHYYLTRSRIDVFGQHRVKSAFVDSLERVFNRSRNLMDSLYYGANLARLKGAQEQYQAAYRYWQIEQQLGRRLDQDVAITQMQRALINSELVVQNRERDYETTIQKKRSQALWILAGLLTVITGLSAYLYRKNQAYRVQSVRLVALNNQLDERVEQVNLLNKEVHHRVKNNLNMIYSLLQMQERKTQHPEVIAQLQQARLRVEAIAALHNQLVSEDNPLDLNRYITSMIEAVVRCYDKPVVTQLDIDLFSLAASQYLPLSLILTEWVTNSMKHAVPTGNVLHIHISLHRQVEGFCAEYNDDGQATLHPPRPNLGMDIVKLLCRQMNARLTSPNQNYYHYRLLLPKQ